MQDGDDMGLEEDEGGRRGRGKSPSQRKPYMGRWAPRIEPTGIWIRIAPDTSAILISGVGDVLMSDAAAKQTAAGGTKSCGRRPRNRAATRFKLLVKLCWMSLR